MTGKGLLRCRIGRDEFAMRAAEVRHVARADQMRADGGADGRIGSLALGGHSVPVFAMSTAMGLGDADAPVVSDQHIAVTGEPHQLVGWLIDHVGRTVADGRIAPLPASIGGAARRWFEGVVTFTEGDVPLLLVSPRQLDPLHDVVEAPPLADLAEDVTVIETSTSAQPVALIFSTDALPASAARRFALSGRQVAAITQPTLPIAVPGSARHVAGLTLWRNTAVPVLDFREEGDRVTAGERQLIARCKSGGRSSLVAFLIDAEIAMHHPDTQNKSLDVPCPPFSSGMFDIDGEAVALLDVDALLTLSPCQAP